MKFSDGRGVLDLLISPPSTRMLVTPRKSASFIDPHRPLDVTKVAAVAAPVAATIFIAWARAVGLSLTRIASASVGWVAANWYPLASAARPRRNNYGWWVTSLSLVTKASSGKLNAVPR